MERNDSSHKTVSYYSSQSQDREEDHAEFSATPRRSASKASSVPPPSPKAKEPLRPNLRRVIVSESSVSSDESSDGSSVQEESSESEKHSKSKESSKSNKSSESKESFKSKESSESKGSFKSKESSESKGSSKSKEVPTNESEHEPSPLAMMTWKDHAMIIPAKESLDDAQLLDEQTVQLLKETALQLSTSRQKIRMPIDESILPTSYRIDLDGLCFVGLPGKPLSFLSLPMKSDEQLVICSSPQNAPKFSAGKHSFGFGSNANKYGSGSVCSGSDLPLGGNTRFCCFGRYGSWPLFFSHDDEEEKEDFWKKVIIPAVEEALPERKHPKRDPKLKDDYPWPCQDQFKLSRKETKLFLSKMNFLCLPTSPNKNQFCQTLGMTIKLGQKSTNLRKEDICQGTIGMALLGFDLAGVSCVFWSTGINLVNDHDRDHAFFWLSGFLENELVRANLGDAPPGTRACYPLLGSNLLMSAQAKGINPVHFQFQNQRLEELAKQLNVLFQVETWQFYSTFTYLFKDGRGAESIPCNPSTPVWRNRSTALRWLLRTLGDEKVSDRKDPLSCFLSILDEVPLRYASRLRVEPTFFLEFKVGLGSHEGRVGILEQLFKKSAKAVGKVYLEACREDASTHFCCLHKSVIERLKTMATCYLVGRERLLATIKTRMAKEGDSMYRPFLTPQEGELLNFLEFSPFFWLTGKSFKVSPKVMRALTVDSAIRNYGWPALPEALFHEEPSNFYRDLLLQPSGTTSPWKSKGKWISKTSTLKYLPQLWFQAKSNPSTSKMKNQTALLLEFASMLDDNRNNPELVVRYFVLLFGFCCLVKSGVDPKLPPPRPAPSGTPGLNINWMVGTQGMSDSEDSDEVSDSEEVEQPVEESSPTEEEAPVARFADPERTLSLNDVRHILSLRQGPLFDPSLAQEPQGSKRKSLVELIKILFVNPVVVTPSYSCPKQDVWVAALRMLKFSIKHGGKRMRTLATESTFIGLLLTFWREYLNFESFWHCTKSSFAKKSTGMFKIADDLENFLPSSLSASGTIGSSGGSSRGDERSQKPLSSHANATLLNKVVEEMKNKADNHFTAKQMLSNQTWMLILKACCFAGKKYGIAEKKDELMVVKFAVICTVRVAQGMKLIDDKDGWGKLVLQKYDKHSGNLKVKVEMLAKYSPFFCGSSKIKCLAMEALQEQIDLLASQYVI